MLGRLRELRRDPIAARMHDGRHPIGPPRPRGAAQPTRHPVDRVDQMREAHALADHRAASARERQRADEHVRRFAPRRLTELQPVSWDLLARLVLKLDDFAMEHRPVDMSVLDEPRHIVLSFTVVTVGARTLQRARADLTVLQADRTRTSHWSRPGALLGGRGELAQRVAVRSLSSRMRRCRREISVQRPVRRRAC
jgi:hypothetical protein